MARRQSFWHALQGARQASAHFLSKSAFGGRFLGIQEIGRSTFLTNDRLTFSQNKHQESYSAITSRAAWTASKGGNPGRLSSCGGGMLGQTVGGHVDHRSDSQRESRLEWKISDQRRSDL